MVFALLAILALISFTAGSLLGSHYSSAVARLSGDFQLSQLSQQGTRRLATSAKAVHLLRSSMQLELAAPAYEQQARRHAREVQRKSEDHLSITEPTLSESTLSFQVCNGFANQRVAVLSGECTACLLRPPACSPMC